MIEGLRWSARMLDLQQNTKKRCHDELKKQQLTPKSFFSEST